MAPIEPSFPKPRLILSLALTGGLLLGLVAMYLVETGQRGLRSEREVAQLLGVPTLALVPRLEPAAARRHRRPRTTGWSGRARATPRPCARS